MSSRSQSDEGVGKQQLQLLVTGGLYVVSTGALLRAVPLLIDNPMAATVLGGAAVSLVAARADVAMEPLERTARMRILWGAAVTVLAVAVGVVAAMLTGGSIKWAGVSAGGVFGIAEAVALGYAREMWLRGIPFTFARRAGVPRAWAFAFGTLAGPAAVVLESNAKPMGIVLTLAGSAAFSAMWLRGGDGYAPITAHIAWAWLCDAALAGEMFDLSQPSGRLTGGAGAHGVSAIAAGVVFAVAAVAIMRDVWSWKSIAADVDAAVPTASADEPVELRSKKKAGKNPSINEPPTKKRSSKKRRAAKTSAAPAKKRRVNQPPDGA